MLMVAKLSKKLHAFRDVLVSLAFVVQVTVHRDKFL